MKLRCYEEGRVVNVTLDQDGGDVNILANGIPIAFLSPDGTLNTFSFDDDEILRLEEAGFRIAESRLVVE